MAPSATAESLPGRVPGDASAVRLRAIVDRHHDFVWRTVRFLGVPTDVADDCVQQVLCVAARRLADIAPGSEMSFLYATAARVASETRRAAGRRRTTPVEDVDVFAASAASPEELVDEHRAHETLREILAGIPEELRMVFALFEIEELTLAEIAAVVGIPQGTVASRLRRAREQFQARVRRRSAQLQVRPRGEGT